MSQDQNLFLCVPGNKRNVKGVELFELVGTCSICFYLDGSSGVEAWRGDCRLEELCKATWISMLTFFHLLWLYIFVSIDLPKSGLWICHINVEGPNFAIPVIIFLTI